LLDGSWKLFGRFRKLCAGVREARAILGDLGLDGRTTWIGCSVGRNRQIGAGIRCRSDFE
jgi:hypothetical protein